MTAYFYFIAAMNKFAFPFLLTLFSSNVWADDITQSLQQSKQQFADLQSQNQQRWLEQHQFQSTSQAVEMVISRKFV